MCDYGCENLRQQKLKIANQRAIDHQMMHSPKYLKGVSRDFYNSYKRVTGGNIPWGENFKEWYNSAISSPIPNVQYTYPAPPIGSGKRRYQKK